MRDTRICACGGPHVVEGGGVDETGEAWGGVVEVAVEEELVDERLAPAPAVNQHVFELDQPGEVGADLEVRPTRMLPDLAAREPHHVPPHPITLRHARDEGVDEAEEPPGLRCEVIEGAAQHVVRQPVRDLDVGDGRLDVGDLDTGVHDGPAGPLVLMQQRDGTNQRQVFHVVTAGAGAAVRERQPPRPGVHHRQRLEEPLRV